MGIATIARVPPNGIAIASKPTAGSIVAIRHRRQLSAHHRSARRLRAVTMRRRDARRRRTGGTLSYALHALGLSRPYRRFARAGRNCGLRDVRERARADHRHGEQRRFWRRSVRRPRNRGSAKCAQLIVSFRRRIGRAHRGGGVCEPVASEGFTVGTATRLPVGDGRRAGGRGVAIAMQPSGWRRRGQARAAKPARTPARLRVERDRLSQGSAHV
mmetsp:Transcript_50512/g.118645  ORF Transcript_50512/g.118645 Transcript_50512/m.118645 type:complete len:215 (-) Transcript_50512:93-737(-)